MKSRIIAALIASSMVLGVVPVQVFAVTDGSAFSFDISKLALEDGVYDIKSELKDEAGNKSMAQNFLKSTQLEVKGGKKYVKIVFTAGSTMKESIITVNSIVVNHEETLSGTGFASQLTLVFPVEDLNDDIKMSTKLGSSIVEFYVRLIADGLDEGNDGETSDEGNQGGDNGNGENQGGDTGSGDQENNEESGENNGTQDDNLGGNTDNGEQNNGNQGGTTEQTPDDKQGTYTIENDALHMSKDEESVARTYLNKISDVEFNEGKIYLTLKFTGKSMMSNHVIKVNGNKVDFEVVDDSGDNFYVKVEIGSLSDKLTVGTTVDLGFVAMDVEFRVVLKEETLKKYTEGTTEPDSTPNPEEMPEITPNENIEGDTGDNNTSQGTDGSQYVDGTYRIKNKVVSDSDIGYQAARQSLAETSYMEVIDGKIYMTIGFGQTNLMSNIRIVINGTTVNYTVVNSSSSNNTKDIKFQVPSIGTTVTVKAYISALGRDISFGVSFLESTLEVISQSQVNNPLGQTTDSSLLTNLSTTNTEEEEIAEDIEVNESYKKYTIENEILSNSETGLSMARKYTDEISILEEIDGELYLTVGFSGTDLIGSIKVAVNGQIVEHSVVSNDDANKTKSIRFPITDVNDEMRVYMYINPVQMNIDYGLKLKEETMTLVEDVTIEENQDEEIIELVTTGSKNSNDIDVFKIALTSSLVTTLAIFSLGGITYTVIKRKKKKKQDN